MSMLVGTIHAQQQYEKAKKEVDAVFPQDEELNQKMRRLDELNILLNMDKKEKEILDEPEEKGQADEKEKAFER